MAQFKHTVSQYYGMIFANGRFIGNATEASTDFATSDQTVANGYTDSDLPLFTYNTVTGGTFKVKLTDTNWKNFAMAWRASDTAETATPFARTIVAGEAFKVIKLDRIATFTSVEIEDVANPGEYIPAVEGSDYQKTAAGLMALVDGSFRLSGTYVAQVNLQAFTNASETIEIEIHGGNKKDKAQAKLTRIFKVKFKPVNASYINANIAELDLEATIEADTTRPAGMSQFMEEFVKEA